MLDLGRFPYINTTTVGKVAIANGKLTLDKTAADQNLNVAYKNDSNKLVTFAPGKVKLYLEDADKNEVGTAGTNAAAVSVNPGATANLLKTAEELVLDQTDLTPGETYTVKVLLNDELQDDVMTVYVKSDNSNAKKVTVKGVEADITTPAAATVKLPVGTDLTALVASDVVVTKDHVGQTVGAITINPAGTSITFTVTAEDGTTTPYTITASVIVAASATPAQKAVDVSIAAPGTPVLAFTNTDSHAITKVTFNGRTLGTAEYTATPATDVTLNAAVMTDYLAANPTAAIGDTITVVVTFAAGGSITYTITLIA